MSVEFTGAATQLVDFGTPAAVVGLTSKSISFWFNHDSVIVGHSYFQISDGTGTDTDEYFDIYTDLGAPAKIKTRVHHATTDGGWITTNNVILSASTWYHVVVTYNGGTAVNSVVTYINGSVVAVTRSTAPVGALCSGASVNLYLGDKIYSTSPDGKMADVRIYNSVLTAAQVLSLHNAGALTSSFDTNLVFNAPLTGATALGGVSYNGFTLTSTEKLIDRINCVEGTATGSPLGSSINP
jgi:hypothetical protein